MIVIQEGSGCPVSAITPKSAQTQADSLFSQFPQADWSG
jgi:hypothetical protein